jgi:hypothetical protein
MDGGRVEFFRRKPVTIEAVRLDPHNLNEILGWIGRNDGVAMPIRTSPQTASRITGSILIHTLEGDHRAEPGDWVIRGVKGEFYPCKPDIFEATYERDVDA